MTARAKNIAVLMLACRDYEAMELALACHMAYGDPDVPFFILQNCRHGYDAERTLGVARRYASLFPKTIRVLDRLPEGAPYRNIAKTLESDVFASFDLVCKVDDDVFPIAPGWLKQIQSTWERFSAQYGPELAYVTPLINNNPWGFSETLKVMRLEDEYFSKIARIHRVGAGDEASPFRLLDADEIATGTNGTIWGAPYVARWVHAHTTLKPDSFVQATRDLTPVLVPSADRYSIGCIVFAREMWARIDNGGLDDEHMWHQYCSRHDLKIFADRSVPFVHLSFFSQREENRDVVEAAKSVYEPRLGYPFPISLRQSRLLDIEARLRWIETHIVPPYPNATDRGGLKSVGKRLERIVRKKLHQLGIKRSKRPG